MEERESGFYWVLIKKSSSWVIGEYDKDTDRWYLTSGGIYKNEELVIDEQKIERL